MRHGDGGRPLRALLRAARPLTLPISGNPPPVAEAGATTVGTRVDLNHLAPQLGRADLDITAVLERVAGQRVQFAVHLRDGDRPVAIGLITRVVDTDAFLGDAGAGVGATG